MYLTAGEIEGELNAAMGMPGWGYSVREAMPPRFKGSLSEAYADGVCHPQPRQWFRALREVGGPENVRVVILGQDPYHGAGQAHGLAFSVPEGVPLPPSLRNIYKEIAQSCGGMPPTSGDLSAWSAQGVLLLNDVLSVADGAPRSHRKLGWQSITSSVLRACDQRPAAFLLWGRHAQAHAAAIRGMGQPHLVLEAPHPSPLSAHRGFLGCGHFEQVNAWLTNRGEEPIAWFAGPWG